MRDKTKTKTKDEGKSFSVHMEYALKTYSGEHLLEKDAKSSRVNKELLATEVALLNCLTHPNIIALKEVRGNECFCTGN